MVVTQGDIVGKFGVINKLYIGSENVAEREVDHRNVGVAAYDLIE